MNWTDRLQRRFGAFAIPGLGRVIVGLQALFFAWALFDPRVPNALVLDPALVAQGQYWRLLTFLFLPSLSPLSVLFAVFFFMFQWMVFEGLESEWGAFKLTLYCALGWLCALALPLAAYAVFGAALPATGGYWSLSIELAFAFMYPEYTIYIYFILPMKMKWMAWLIGAFLLYQVFSEGWIEALPIAVGLMNYLLFFGPELVHRARFGAQVQRNRRSFDSARRQAERALAPRACSLCGAGPESYLRLCTCPRCDAEGRLWCDAHLPAHLDTQSGGPMAINDAPNAQATAVNPRPPRKKRSARGASDLPPKKQP